MADLSLELANLNSNARALLDRYANAVNEFEGLSETKKQELINLVAQKLQEIDDVGGVKLGDDGVLRDINNNPISVDNALKLGGKSLEEIKDELIPVGTILEFMLIENGKVINFANDPIDEKASSKGFELFCPHNKEEYEKARQYLVSIGKPKAMGPLGIYKPSNGAKSQRRSLNSDFMGKDGWKVQDGSPTWWASDITNVTEPNGDYTANAYLGITYNDNGFITWYNDGYSSYKYNTYLCVRIKK